VKALAEALRENEALNELNLQANQIGDEGALALAEMLEHNPALSILNIEQNAVSDVGGGALLAVLQSNTSALETLHLSGNPISSDMLALVQRTTEQHNLPPPDHGDEL
jgi:NLR family CARD domain-containing protein 3